jgi:hypothetical protein
VNGFDPHPAGCPIGLRVEPREMPELVRAIWSRLRDVVNVGVFVVNPSRGESYPILYVSGNEAGALRVALFPGWEDSAHRRRIDYARQTSLLQRIQDAGIAPEPLDSTHGLPSERSGPVFLPLDVSPEGMSQVLHDLWERLGPYLRMTVTKVPHRGGELRLVRAYVLDDEVLPRLVLHPGWDTSSEQISGAEAAALDERARKSGTAELPIEALFVS